MDGYLLIESRDPFDSNAVAQQCALAAALARAGHSVTVFLVQNGVLPARACEKSSLITRMSQAGVDVLADDFSLRERGIAQSSLVQGVRAAPLSTVIDHLTQGRKCLWH